MVSTETSLSPAAVGVNTDLKKINIVGDDQRGRIVRHNRSLGLGVAGTESERTWDQL